MGRLERDLSDHKRIGVDTAPFIYLWERNPAYLTLSQELFGYLNQPQVQGFTSIITMIEVCVQPQRQGRLDVVNAYQRALLHSKQISTVFIDASVAQRAMALRAHYYPIRVPDALQLAAALESQATAFVTNDRRLARIRELHVLVLDEYLG